MALTAVLLLTLIQPQPSAHDPRPVVEGLFAAYRALDTERLVATLSPDITFEDPTTRLRANGRAEMRTLAEGIKTSYRQVTIDVHSMIVSGNDVAVQVTISGTVVKPDGTTRQIRVRGASFFRVRNGLIEQWTDYFDARTLAEQSR